MTDSPVVCSFRDQFAECVKLRLERANPSELDVLLESHLNQEGLYPREPLRDGLHDSGHDRPSTSTTSVMSRHGDTVFASTNRLVFCFAHSGSGRQPAVGLVPNTRRSEGTNVLV